MKTLVAEALEVLSLVKGMLEVPLLVLLADVLEVELAVVLVMVRIVLELLVLVKLLTVRLECAWSRSCRFVPCGLN